LKKNTKNIDSISFRTPETRKPAIFVRLSIFTFIIICPYAMGISMPIWLELSIFSFFIIVTGIPHGAIDHIVAAKVYKLENTMADKMKFYSSYLLAMLLLGAVWIISPLSGFIIFLATSVYHFGQGDLAYVTSRISGFKQQLKSVETLLFISRGMMLIAMPVLFHTEITSPIIESATRGSISAQNFVYENGPVLATVAFLFHLVIFLLFLPPWRNTIFKREFYLILILGSLFLFAHPLVSFAVYFGLWHGLNHFFELRDFLQDGGSDVSFVKLYKETIPFTLLSFFGLSILWLAQDAIGLQNQMVSLLFILISVLTLPHMLLIDRMYSNSRTNNSD
jgi:Brp/Blh family beta-carotene 15,15'-monooxygenase